VIMKDFPEELKYCETHAWVLREGSADIVTVGITSYAQEKLEDIIYVKLPEIGLSIAAGDEVCVLESVRLESEVFSPVSGKIVAINEDLEDAPGMVNTDPYQDGWLYKIELKDPVEYDELLDNESYQEYLAEIEEDD